MNTSSLFLEQLNADTKASRTQNKSSRVRNVVKEKQRYNINKEFKKKLNATLEKLLTPIADDLLTTLMRLENKTGKIFVKNNFDNKKYKIEFRICR